MNLHKDYHQRKINVIYQKIPSLVFKFQRHKQKYLLH